MEPVMMFSVASDTSGSSDTKVDPLETRVDWRPA